MSPTKRDKNRYAIIARVSEEGEEAPRNWEEALHAQHIYRIGVSKVAHDISVHLDDEDLSTEETRVLAILAITEQSLLPARALLDAASLRLNQGI
ncbi:hypothetical protein [Bilophila wadsworthia]|uniref:hypothetical protein n=1 Tax=Bilophila wadsworthia TaxID=35833 RepID=UPI002A7F64FC|nr:hypothetical protein [Bilophila wadsworthia]MDY3682301.1 hypothetical protein [Bilophila wadsworthia]